MRHPKRLSLLFIVGILAAGSTALGVYYYFVYEPPLAAAEVFMQAMEKKDIETLKNLVMVTLERDSTAVRSIMPAELKALVNEPFHRGRILTQDRRNGASGNYDFLVYREPDGSIYALHTVQMGLEYKIVIPERPRNPKTPYLWDYNWTDY
jgi:hypothetical protein